MLGSELHKAVPLVLLALMVGGCTGSLVPATGDPTIPESVSAAVSSTAVTTPRSTATVTTVTAAGGMEPWPTGLSWSWILQGGPVPDVDADAIDVDLFETSGAEVARIEEEGVRTICYISIGTYEKNRPDAGAYSEEILGKNWDEWNERFVDIRRLDILGPILEARLDLCAAKGFSAVEPDNIDIYGADTGFGLTPTDASVFARWFAERAHERGLAVAQKNAPELIADLVDSFDFIITEDCFDDGWCEETAPYRDAGKAIFDAEYTDRMSELDPSLCARASDLGISVLLADRSLTENLDRCP